MFVLKGILLQALFHSNSHGNGHTDHGVVASAQEAHHFHVGRDGGRTGELSVAVHTAHGVGQAVGSGAGSHVVGVQGTARATAGGHGEVLLALLDALFLVSACNGVLEAGGLVELPVMETSTPSKCMMATPSRTSSQP